MRCSPYGETWVEDTKDVLDNLNYAFSGKELDRETGLYYYGARYLDPRTSAWLSADPALAEYLPVAPVSDEAKRKNESLPGMGGVFNPVNLALYHYAGNNPVRYTDPDGNAYINGVYIPDSAKTGNYDTPNKDQLLYLYEEAKSEVELEKRMRSMPIYTDNKEMTTDLTDLNILLGVRCLFDIGADILGAIKGAAGNEGRIVTVLGSQRDTAKYLGKPGYNVLKVLDNEWSAKLNIKWLDGAIRRGDEIRFVTDPVKFEQLMIDLGKKSQFIDLEIPYLKWRGVMDTVTKGF